MTQKTISAYLAAQPPDRRAALTSVIEVMNESVQRGFVTGIVYGMPSWYVSLARYPDTYNGQPLTIASLGAQKSHLALYLMCIDGDPGLRSRFEREWKASGKKLDMGKACLRFRSADDLALDVIAGAVRSVTLDGFLAAYEAARAKPKKAANERATKKPRT